MRSRLAILADAILLSMSTITLAQPPASIHDRINFMEQRIDRGVRSGELTRHEAGKLRKELGAIRQRERRMREDGRLSPRERDALQGRLDRLDRQIKVERRDGEHRGPPRR